MAAKNNAAFGVTTKRFNNIGFHPDLDPTGCMRKNRVCLGPGQYNPEKFECMYKKCNLTRSRYNKIWRFNYEYALTKPLYNFSWERKAEVEKFSTNLGYRNAYILEDRRFWKSQGGPGTYDISDSLFRKHTSSCKTDTFCGSQKRFHTTIKKEAPPPGTYIMLKSKYR